MTDRAGPKVLPIQNKPKFVKYMGPLSKADRGYQNLWVLLFQDLQQSSLDNHQPSLWLDHQPWRLSHASFFVLIRAQTRLMTETQKLNLFSGRGPTFIPLSVLNIYILGMWAWQVWNGKKNCNLEQIISEKKIGLWLIDRIRKNLIDNHFCQIYKTIPFIRQSLKSTCLALPSDTIIITLSITVRRYISLNVVLSFANLD